MDESENVRNAEGTNMAPKLSGGWCALWSGSFLAASFVSVWVFLLTKTIL